MIEIVLLVLKIIGIIVAVLLGIILLLCAIVCFVPITYLLQGSIQETKESIQAKVQVNWLFHIIRIRLSLVEGHTLRYECYIFGFKIKSGELGDEELPDDEEPEELEAAQIVTSATKEREVKQAPVQEVASVTKECEVKQAPVQEVISEKQDITQTIIDNSQEVDQAITNESQDVFQGDSEFIDIEYEKELSGEKDTDKSQDVSISEVSEEEPEQKQNIFEKISSKIRELCDKIKTLMEMKDKVVQFYYHPVHQRALQKLKREGIYHLRKLKPRVFEATGVVGFNSPDQTGYMAAGLSMLLPIYGEHIDIQPEFEEARMNVQGKIAGKIRVYPFVLSLIRLVVSRDFRRTISDAKKLQITKL